MTATGAGVAAREVPVEGSTRTVFPRVPGLPSLTADKAVLPQDLDNALTPVGVGSAAAATAAMVAVAAADTKAVMRVDRAVSEARLEKVA